MSGIDDYERLPSTTYKLRSPGVSSHAGYFTIVGEDVPVAFFFNSKEMQAFQWIMALMTSYSKQIKHGAPVTELVADMKDTFDAGRSYVIPDGSGRKVNSVVHHLGLILELHMKEVEKKK